MLPMIAARSQRLLAKAQLPLGLCCLSIAMVLYLMRSSGDRILNSLFCAVLVLASWGGASAPRDLPCVRRRPRSPGRGLFAYGVSAARPSPRRPPRKETAASPTPPRSADRPVRSVRRLGRRRAPPPPYPDVLLLLVSLLTNQSIPDLPPFSRTKRSRRAQPSLPARRDYGGQDGGSPLRFDRPAGFCG